MDITTNTTSNPEVSGNLPLLCIAIFCSRINSMSIMIEDSSKPYRLTQKVPTPNKRTMLIDPRLLFRFGAPPCFSPSPRPGRQRGLLDDSDPLADIIPEKHDGYPRLNSYNLPLLSSSQCQKQPLQLTQGSSDNGYSCNGPKKLAQHGIISPFYCVGSPRIDSTDWSMYEAVSSFLFTNE